MKSYCFTALVWENKDENMWPNKFSQSIGQCISQLLKTNLLSETIYSQTHPAFVC